MEKLLNSGSVSRDEWLIFSRMPTEFPASDLEESDSPIPHWLPRRAWLAIDELEVLPAFKGLKNSVANQSEQWREYFNVSSGESQLGYGCGVDLLSYCGLQRRQQAYHLLFG